MKHLRWVCAGVLVGLAGTVALAIATAPSRGTVVSSTASATVPAVAVTPALPAVAPTAAPAVPAPVVAAAPRAAEVTTGIVPGTAGMLIAIDPETGEPGMPSPEQIAEMKLSEDETVSKEGYTVSELPNGTLVLEANGRFQEYAVLRRTADGKIVTGCVSDPKHLNDLVPAPSGLEEK
jgi:hypothetical protein